MENRVAFFGSFFSRIADGSLSAFMRLIPLGAGNAKNERPRSSENSDSKVPWKKVLKGLT